MTAARRSLVSLASLGLCALAPRVAGATDERPTLVSDAFYLGARAEPGWALAAGWDLDIYPTSDRAVSFGPGITVTALSTAAPSPRTQSVMVSVDALRLKVGLNHPGGFFRPFALVAGGFLWTRFEQRIEGPAGGFDESFAGLATVGAGADLWGRGRFGVTALLLTRLRAFGSDRLPAAWFECSVGFRFGL